MSSLLQPPESGNSNTRACPVWCPGGHPAGAVHRREVGATVVGGERIPVVILQIPQDAPVVIISGPVYVEVHPEDYADMAGLLELAGHGDLAWLVRVAAERLNGGESGQDAPQPPAPCRRCRGERTRWYQGRGNGDYFRADCDACGGTGLDGGGSGG